MPFRFDNSYADLPAHMFTKTMPIPVASPSLFAQNTQLGAQLGLEPRDLSDADVFAGNAIPKGADPLAQLYAGHQFGSWNPQLGDGRAILLGEIKGTDGQRYDIQLKGAGRTPYSRGGDGRAWLGPVMREYLVSEAMHAMGVPTTRALAAATTGETVYREEPLPGAVLTRVAQSHIRVGTFQIYAARQDTHALRVLYEHVLSRHYPDIDDDPATLLNAVITRQANLIAKWMGLGFIHGVMNTDNVSIAGETIDYGPCAFMDSYHPQTVFSAIDQMGRYAYQNQPNIAAWNMAQFATSLIPLMPDQDAAITTFTAAVNRFPDIYNDAYRSVLASKLGLKEVSEDSDTLATELLTLMADEHADFTNTFAGLASGTANAQFVSQDVFADWQRRWARLQPDETILTQHNPTIIPRNHRIAEAIAAGQAGDFQVFDDLLDMLTKPYAPLDDKTEAYARAPSTDERVTRTFCGT
jgi:uncharacterized protein YdiU (UPF0061 family)